MKPYKIALLMGTHQHRWDAETGVCEKCRKEHTPHNWTGGVCNVCGYGCTHPQGWNPWGSRQTHRCPVCNTTQAHTITADATKEACFHCDVCGAVYTAHSFSNSVCGSCGYVCNHAGTLVDTNENYHRCTFCGNTALEHTYANTATKEICRTCSGCGRQITKHAFGSAGNTKAARTCTKCGYVCTAHTWSSPSASRHYCSYCNYYEEHTWNNISTEFKCRECSVCGYNITAHSWSNGVCTACGYVCTHSRKTYGVCNICGLQVCSHANTTTDANNQIICSDCGAVLRYSNDVFYVRTGTYAGSYRYDSTLKGLKCYAGYKGGTSITNGWYLFAMNVTTPTSFDGEFLYTVTGLAFSESKEVFPVNNTLAQGNGKYIKTIKQYEQDGTYKAELKYTSDDFPEISGIDKDTLIAR